MEPIRYQDELLSLSASVGVAIFPDDGTDIDSLIDIADCNMYHIKMGYKKTPA